MCPNCRAFITTDDRQCPYCGVKPGERQIDIRQPNPILGGLIPQANFTTTLILLINLGLFIATWYLSKTMGENVALWSLGGKYGPSIWRDHEWWRLVTAGFLHAGILHIGMNSWVLYDLGAQVEQVFGTWRFLVIYFVGTVGGFYLSLLWSPVLSIGASAGIMGLIGAMVAFGVANRSSVGRSIRNFYLRWVVYVLAIGFIGGFGTDNGAHIGGLIAGFLVGYIAGTPVRSSEAREGMWRVLGMACIIATAVCFAFAWRNFSTPPG